MAIRGAAGRRPIDDPVEGAALFVVRWQVSPKSRQ